MRYGYLSWMVGIGALLIISGCSDDSVPREMEFGLGHACGLLDTGEIACVGDDDFGQASPPQGAFVSVAAGDRHTCGVRETGSVVCWGDDQAGQSSPPGGAFLSVSAGAFYTCGVRSKGTIVCWGRGMNGAVSPMEGTFVSVEAGDSHICGMGENGDVACWSWYGWNRPLCCGYGYPFTYWKDDGIAVPGGEDAPLMTVDDLGEAYPPGFDPLTRHYGWCKPWDWAWAHREGVEEGSMPVYGGVLAPSCNPHLVCAAVETCFGGMRFPTACGPGNCDVPIGLCEL